MDENPMLEVIVTFGVWDGVRTAPATKLPDDIMIYVKRFHDVLKKMTGKNADVFARDTYVIVSEVELMLNWREMILHVRLPKEKAGLLPRIAEVVAPVVAPDYSEHRRVGKELANALVSLLELFPQIMTSSSRGIDYEARHEPYWLGTTLYITEK